MQAIGIPPSALKHVLPITILAYLYYSLLEYLRQTAKNTSIVVLVLLIASICFNPYIYDLISKDGIDSVQQISWAIFILSDSTKKQYNFHYIYVGLSTVLNPSNFLFFIIKIITASNKRAKIFIFAVGVTLCLSYLWLAQQLSVAHYFQLYFPATFEPQFNLMWMLYAHMFDRYIQLYQLLFLVMLVSSAYLIYNLQFKHQFKVVLLIYFKVYCHYKCSELCVILALLLVFLLMHQQLICLIQSWSILKQEKQVIKVKTLTLIIVIANIVFWPLDKILLHKYLNDFSINIGYLFLFFGFPWILNSVYLAQISLNINEIHHKTSQNSSQSILTVKQ